MELNRVVCTTCGNVLEASIEENIKKCDACGNTFLITNGKEFAIRSDEERSGIKKLRSNLERAIIADDHKNILSFSKEILRLIPKDYLANYYFSYANYAFGSRRYLFDFYEQIVTELPIVVDLIIEHIITYSDVRDRGLIETFIARNNPDKLDLYRAKYQQKLVDEENYSSIPRDIFISFRSSEIEQATEVLQILEKDGNSCWISSRNLRPNDNDNYWTNIEDAINKSRLFLVISSHDAMISRDVKKELDIATKGRKQRLEYKIDKSKHTSTFKYFFDGYKWIDATVDKTEALSSLKKRVYDILNSEKKQVDAKSPKIKSSENDEFRRKINRVNIELLNSNFKEAGNTVKDALGINPESTEAWWKLFLAENSFLNTELFSNYIEKKQTLSKLFDLRNRVSYKQFIKYSNQEGIKVPPAVDKFEKFLYEDIVDYLNKPNLPEKNKRDFLNSYCSDHILSIWANIFLMAGFKTDIMIDQMIDNESKIKELENIFENFDAIKEHKDYDNSHLKKYYERFYKNHAKTMEKRSHNLVELNAGIEKLYTSIEKSLQKGKFKDALSNSMELFYFDNTSVEKYYYLLLSKMKAKSSVELYDSLSKLRKKEKNAIVNSVIFEKMFASDKYQVLVQDLMINCFYKKVKKSDRILLDVRSEENGV